MILHSNVRNHKTGWEKLNVGFEQFREGGLEFGMVFDLRTVSYFFLMIFNNTTATLLQIVINFVNFTEIANYYTVLKISIISYSVYNMAIWSGNKYFFLQVIHLDKHYRTVQILLEIDRAAYCQR